MCFWKQKIEFRLMVVRDLNLAVSNGWLTAGRLKSAYLLPCMLAPL